MTNKLIKKSIALIGAVMMLANVVLPSGVFAWNWDSPEDPKHTPGNPLMPVNPKLTRIQPFTVVPYSVQRGGNTTNVENLPKTAIIELDNNTTKEVNITWRNKTFDTLGNAELNGDVVIPEGVDRNNVSTNVTVNVEVKMSDVDRNKVNAAVLTVAMPNHPKNRELSTTTENSVYYYGTKEAPIVNSVINLQWTDKNFNVPMVNCSFKGADNKNYNNLGVEAADENQACNLFIKDASIAAHKLAEKKQSYTLTVDFGDNVKKVYTLKFERATVNLTLKDGKETIKHDVVAYKGEALPKLNDPTKPRYRFVEWTTDEDGKLKYDLATVVNDDNLTLYAQWKRSPSASGGGSSSSSSSSSNTTTTTGAQAQSGAQLSGVVATGTNESKVVKTLESLRSGAVDQAASTPEKAKQLEVLKASLQSESNTELRDAYTYTYLRGMTTQPTIQQADLHRGLTRAEMAKMMSVFAVKVFGKAPVLTGTVEYKDLNQVNGDLTGYIQQAYQLQIMGIDAKGNPIANFNPNAQVTRAEFATVLSRVLYGDKYNQEGANFAEKHLEALKAANILKDTTPTMKESRGWVMLMLMRAEGVK